MHAIRFHQYGAPEVLQYEECEAPHARAGQLLVEVEAAGVNPFDWQIRSGLHAARNQGFLPAVPGTDFSGRIISVGAGVRSFIPGDKVFGQCDFGTQGTYADFVSVSAHRLALIPHELGMLRAASLPTAALAAWRALFTFGDLQAGQKILVAGVSGCIGFMTAQLSQLIRDVQVVGACTRRQMSDQLRSICADLIDIESESAVTRHRGQFDLVLNLVGSSWENCAIAAAKRGGKLITASPTPDFARCRSHSIRAIGLDGYFDRASLEMIGRLMVSGVIASPRLHIEHLANAASVHRMGERRLLHGKAVLVTG